jgi:hypothetical protein
VIIVYPPTLDNIGFPFHFTIAFVLVKVPMPPQLLAKQERRLMPCVMRKAKGKTRLNEKEQTVNEQFYIT